jgi:cytochrome c553
MKFIAIALSVTVLASGQVVAGNADAGRIKAGTCAGCHGTNGISAVPNYPNLKGQKEQYLVKALRAYREGRRTDPVMSPMAKPLSDRDIDNLAAHFSGL